jgi:chromate reductase
MSATPISATYDVAVVVGSLRKESFTRKLAQAMIALAPDNLKLEIVEWGEVAVFNQDLEKTPPAANAAFKERIRRADAVLFATPEYNRSVPGGLKNALDVASRPYGDSAWSGKPAAIVSNSPGAIGGFGANHHLRQSLVFLDMPTLAQPEAYVGQAATLVDDQGQITNDATRDFLAGFMKTFAGWIATNARR